MSEAVYFESFCKDLLISPDTRSTISTRYLAICTRLNKDFWNMDTSHGGKYVGSFGRNTANGRVSDIDIVFEMPTSVYSTYNSYHGNGQSALLQAVKKSIAATYSTTELKSDGQIVQVAFTDTMKFEVLPVFSNGSSGYIFADSNNGGTWKTTNPIPEIDAVASGDELTNNNLRHLCRMIRAWKHYCSVPIKGLLIDSLAYRFLTNWPSRDKSYLYYDLMCRDFFEYLKNQLETQTTWYAIGSGQAIFNPENFRYKATLAFNISKDAIQYQRDNKEDLAKQKWREIYGYRFPG